MGWELWEVEEEGGGNCGRLKKRGWELWEDEEEGGWELWEVEEEGDGNCGRLKKKGWELHEVGEEGMGTVGGWRRRDVASFCVGYLWYRTLMRLGCKSVNANELQHCISRI